MCDCPEIQGEWKLPPLANDFCCRFRDGLIKSGQNLSAMEYDAETWIWLPRQDQIQEMIPGCKCYVCLIEGIHKFLEDNLDGMFEAGIEGGMEQLWLAFYMHEKHKLIWNGSEWLNKIKE